MPSEPPESSEGPKNTAAPEAGRRLVALDGASRERVSDALAPIVDAYRPHVLALRALADEIDVEVDRITRAQARLFGEPTKPGEVAPAQLTTQEVEAIKRLVLDVVDPSAIAETYRVSFSTVLRIASGELFDAVNPWKVSTPILAMIGALQSPKPETFVRSVKSADARTLRAALSHRVLVQDGHEGMRLSKAWHAFATLHTKPSEPVATSAPTRTRTTRRKRTET